ncbi:MAG TPA: hypothetical protein VF607_15910 [Verrucomicrobiae bacterium]
MPVHITSALPSGNTAQWAVFLGIMLSGGLAACAVIYGLFFRASHRRRRRKHRRHSRQHNPTLAERGGLPPARESDQPPAGL